MIVIDFIVVLGCRHYQLPCSWLLIMRVTTVTIQYNDIPLAGQWLPLRAWSPTPRTAPNPLLQACVLPASLFLLPHRHDAEQNRPAFKQGQAPRFSTRLQILPHVQLPAPGRVTRKLVTFLKEKTLGASSQTCHTWCRHVFTRVY